MVNDPYGKAPMMKLRHIIVEGPDGSGKDTLIDLLTKELQLERHSRATETSVSGPLPQLNEWFYEDLCRINVAPRSVYNRHPLVSEPIYAPLARHVPPVSNFAHPGWVQTMKARMAQHTAMVWCLPPFITVKHNIEKSNDNQLPGVLDAIRPIYDAYRVATNTWPGLQCCYDYTSGNPYDVVTMMRALLFPSAPKVAA